MTSKDKKCTWNISSDISLHIECSKEVRWEVGMSYVDVNLECCGNNDYQIYLCDKHFVDIDGCGNAVEFREIGEEEWIDITNWDCVIDCVVRNRSIREWLKQYKEKTLIKNIII